MIEYDATMMREQSTAECNVTAMKKTSVKKKLATQEVRGACATPVCPIAIAPLSMSTQCTHAASRAPPHSLIKVLCHYHPKLRV